MLYFAVAIVLLLITTDVLDLTHRRQERRRSNRLAF